MISSKGQNFDKQALCGKPVIQPVITSYWFKGIEYSQTS